MNAEIEYKIRSLAYHMWRSAGQDYGRAMDFWVMAEQMVLELVAATARLSGKAMDSAVVAAERSAPWLAAAYLQRNRELAHAMWEAAGQRQGQAIDYWLAAERHIMTMIMSFAAGNEGKPEAMVEKALESFSAQAYLDRIRTLAYYMWEAAGQQYGDALEFWVAAERQMLDAMVAAAAGDNGPAAESGRGGDGRPGTSSSSSPPRTGARAAADAQQGRGGAGNGSNGTLAGAAEATSASAAAQEQAAIRVRLLGAAGASQ